MIYKNTTQCHTFHTILLLTDVCLCVCGRAGGDGDGESSYVHPVYEDQGGCQRLTIV